MSEFTVLYKTFSCMHATCEISTKIRLWYINAVDFYWLWNYLPQEYNRGRNFSNKQNFLYNNFENTWDNVCVESVSQNLQLIFALFNANLHTSFYEATLAALLILVKC